jgi:sigma-E factor negative regulatory protein RseB
MHPASLPTRSLRHVGRLALALCALGAFGLASAEGPHGYRPSGAGGQLPERGVSEWLLRMHEASRRRSYVGTFVVSSSAGALSSARIWHACEGDLQMERVESLTGAPRSTFRRNDEVLTFLPEQHVVRSEKHGSPELFPHLLTSGENSIPEYYSARRSGIDRVAGFDTEVVQLAPRDNLRFGYRIWSEKRSGLVVKLQTLDTDGNVLEQAAFSELQLDAPVRMDRLAQMMASTDGYRIEKTDVVRTTPAAEGWTLRTAVAGFKPMSCYKRPQAENTMQWIFSDGLASVSLFVEPYDRQRHSQEGLFAAVGATQTLTHRIQDWWVTAVGEVPPHTLRAFAQSLERRK